jgi:hypothetical protein
MRFPGTKARLGLAAGLVGGTVGVAVLSGFGPAPAHSSIGSSHDDTTTTAVPASVPSGTASDASETRTIDAAGAGTVIVDRQGGQLTLVSATPNAGWTVEVEQAAGGEVEVDFRMAGQRVQVNVEFEDGAIRERVRVRDDVAGTEVRIENGVVVRAEGFDDPAGADDNQGPGDNRGPGNADDGTLDDDHGNDDVNDDHGNDDVNDDDGAGDVDDDHSGSSGSGSSGSGSSGGSDDPAGDDHGGVD